MKESGRPVGECGGNGGMGGRKRTSSLPFSINKNDSQVSFQIDYVNEQLYATCQELLSSSKFSNDSVNEHNLEFKSKKRSERKEGPFSNFKKFFIGSNKPSKKLVNYYIPGTNLSITFCSFLDTDAQQRNGQ